MTDLQAFSVDLQVYRVFHWLISKYIESFMNWSDFVYCTSCDMTWLQTAQLCKHVSFAWLLSVNLWSFPSPLSWKGNWTSVRFITAAQSKNNSFCCSNNQINCSESSLFMYAPIILFDVSLCTDWYPLVWMRIDNKDRSLFVHLKISPCFRYHLVSLCMDRCFPVLLCMDRCFPVLLCMDRCFPVLLCMHGSMFPCLALHGSMFPCLIMYGSCA